jgi:hypothetical protein
VTTPCPFCLFFYFGWSVLTTFGLGNNDYKSYTYGIER